MRPDRLVSPAASAVHHLIDADLKVAPVLENVIHKFAGADAYVASFAEATWTQTLPDGSARTAT